MLSAKYCSSLNWLSYLTFIGGIDMNFEWMRVNSMVVQFVYSSEITLKENDVMIFVGFWITNGVWWVD